MAIQVSGTTVIDNDKNVDAGIVTATSIITAPEPITFSPVDGATGVAIDDNIVITYNSRIAMSGIGSINFREGSASGSISTYVTYSGYGAYVSVSGNQFTINPINDLPTGKNFFVVIDEGYFRTENFSGTVPQVNTYNFTTGPITTINLTPSDGATGQSVSSNISINFSEVITKGSGNITIRSGSASGTVLQTIDVTSSAVSVSGAVATINPPSNLAYETDQYIVVDAGCFRNSDGDVDSGNAIIDTYNFTTEVAIPPLGNSHQGGYLLCCSSNNLWIAAPESSEVSRTWYQRDHAETRSFQVSGCSGWFVPTCAQLKNPGYQCRTHWDSISSASYWSNTESGGSNAFYLYCPNGATGLNSKTNIQCVRAFRCVSY